VGQYFYLINFEKKEFVHPHTIGCGLKLSEQAGSLPGTGTAMVILMAAMPEARGGGDFDKTHCEICRRIIGRWAGNRVALIGDYAHPDDLMTSGQHKGLTVHGLSAFDALAIFKACEIPYRQVWTKRPSKKYDNTRMMIQGDPHYGMYYHFVEGKSEYKNISLDVAHVIEVELGGKYSNDDWRDFKYGDGSEGIKAMAPDIVVSTPRRTEYRGWEQIDDIPHS
jgi:hypothetical protein